MLKDIIPARFRKAVYAAYALAATVVGALAIAGVNVGKAPDVLAYLGIAVGTVAAGNVGGNDAGEDGAVSVATVCLVVIATVLLLSWFGVHGHVG